MLTSLLSAKSTWLAAGELEVRMTFMGPAMVMFRLNIPWKTERLSLDLEYVVI